MHQLNKKREPKSGKPFRELNHYNSQNDEENGAMRLYNSQKLYTHSHQDDDINSNPKLSSVEIMDSINSSFDGLFSRIKQIKEAHTNFEQKNNDENYHRFPTLELKPPKLPIKPFSMKTLSVEEPITPHKAETQRPDQTQKAAKYIKSGGLLEIPAMKMSIEITDEIFDKTKATISYNVTPTKEQPLLLTISDFELGKCVGSGKFGDVFACKHKETGTLYALKKIFKSTIYEYNMIEQFTRQLRIHYILDHPNIVKLYTHFDDDYHVFLLMEYVEGGILLNKLKCTEEYASHILEQTINAVSDLHSRQIAHRDIKPENIVLQFDDVVKICDFGWSSYYRNQMKTTFCGTLDYLSPEMKDKGQYDSSVDLWSLGVLCYELLVGEAPYKKQISNWKNKGSKREQKWNWSIIYPSNISTVAESFMRNLLKEKPEQRATLAFCLNHFFIRKYRKVIDESQEINDIVNVIQ